MIIEMVLNLYGFNLFSNDPLWHKVWFLVNTSFICFSLNLVFVLVYVCLSIKGY